MKYHIFRLYFFLCELGRQQTILYTGNGAPFQKVHWFKTRAGVKTAWQIGTLMADIRFDRLPF